jgi:hypothetical protein
MALSSFNIAWLRTFRTAVHGIVTLFSLIVFAICIHIIVWTKQYRIGDNLSDDDPSGYDPSGYHPSGYHSSSYYPSGYYFPFVAMGVAISLLTLLTLPMMLILDHQHKGAITSQIMVELAWFGTLAIFWIATAGLTSGTAWVANCSVMEHVTDIGIIPSICREAQAVEAFAHLNWLWLFVYTFTILVFALISHNNGRDVWCTSVRDGQFATTRIAITQPVYYETDPAKMVPVQQQVPVLTGQAYPPQPGYVSPQQTGYIPPQPGYVSPQPTGYIPPQPGYPVSPYQAPAQVPGSPQPYPEKVYLVLVRVH